MPYSVRLALAAVPALAAGIAAASATGGWRRHAVYFLAGHAPVATVPPTHPVDLY